MYIYIVWAVNHLLPDNCGSSFASALNYRTIIVKNMKYILMLLFLFDDHNIKMARKPGKKQKENPVGCTGEGNIREGSREGKMRTFLELSLEVR